MASRVITNFFPPSFSSDFERDRRDYEPRDERHEFKPRDERREFKPRDDRREFKPRGDRRQDDRRREAKVIKPDRKSVV